MFDPENLPTIIALGALILIIVSATLNFYQNKDFMASTRTFITGLSNNTQLKSVLKHEIEDWPEAKRQAALVFLDVLSPLTETTANDIDNDILGYLVDVFTLEEVVANSETNTEEQATEESLG